MALGLEMVTGRAAPGPQRQTHPGCRLRQRLLHVAHARRRCRQCDWRGPGWLFFCQFQAVQRYLSEPKAWHLPFLFEDLPANLEGFDTVFSMGVFYHRRSPIEHLLALKDTLVKGGELVLETLVVEGDQQQVLVPEDRYAQMRNVWFLPSVPALMLWLRRAGFSDVRCVDVSVTTVEEQRGTEWMKYQSLSDFLDRRITAKTLEGLPAPMRAVIIAKK